MKPETRPSGGILLRLKTYTASIPKVCCISISNMTFSGARDSCGKLATENGQPYRRRACLPAAHIPQTLEHFAGTEVCAVDIEVASQRPRSLSARPTNRAEIDSNTWRASILHHTIRAKSCKKPLETISNTLVFWTVI